LRAILELQTGSLTSRVDQDVESRSIGVGAVRLQTQSVRAFDKTAELRQRHDSKAVLGMITRPVGEHLPWTNGVEFLDLRK
jgi:hypothetical protein